MQNGFMLGSTFLFWVKCYEEAVSYGALPLSLLYTCLLRGKHLKELMVIWGINMLKVTLGGM